MLNFEPHKPTYKISIEVGRSVGRSFIARIQPTIIRLTLRRSAIMKGTKVLTFSASNLERMTHVSQLIITSETLSLTLAQS